MSDKYKATDLEKAYFLTTTVVGWIDLFTWKRNRDIIVNALKYCQANKGLEIYGWCLMPSHLHLICRSNSNMTVADIMRDFKRHTSKQLIASVQESGESRKEWILEQFRKACAHLKRDQKFKVWQNGYHAEELASNKFIYQKLVYLHMNPVKDGIVEHPEEYKYSSGPAYADKEGLLNVAVLPQELKTVCWNRVTF